MFIVRQFRYLSYVIEFKYSFMLGAVLGADDTKSRPEESDLGEDMDRLAGAV